MLQNKTWVFTMLIGLLLGCDQSKEKNISPVKESDSPFTIIIEESEKLLLLLKNNLLVMDSTNIESLAESQKITLEGNAYRASLDFGNISLKKVFRCVNNLINVVHFDFYYDTVVSNLKQDEIKVLDLIQANLGQYTSFDSTSSMKIFTWSLAKNILDYEQFENGFTFTVRKNNSFPDATENILPKQLKLADLLIGYIYNDSINLKSAAIELKSLFKLPFKVKPSALAFSETYHDNILLSGSFEFNGKKLTGVYFDYMYSDSLSQEFIEDAKKIKTMISLLYGPPNEVATVSLSTSYKWDNTPIVVDIYGDGFSILFEKEGL